MQPPDNIEQAAERIAKTYDDYFDGRLDTEHLKKLILTDPFIQKLIADGERLDWLDSNETDNFHELSWRHATENVDLRTAIDSVSERKGGL